MPLGRATRVVLCAPMLTVRRLGPGDEPILVTFAEEDADFDLSERGDAKRPLGQEAARGYLSDPSVLHWIAEERNTVLGHLHCQLVRRASGEELELLLYEIGVRTAARRRGVGTALVDTMLEWMASNDVPEAWVLADNPGATEFYAACGFQIAADAPVYLTRRLKPR
jgi:ribosomal protein S18 acetylase RimI-like enzyme